MIAVAGHWEIGYSTPIIEANYWNLVLRDFEVWDWWMHPISGITHNEGRVKLRECKDFPGILDETAMMTRVFVEPRNPQRPLDSVDLKDFEHPEDALYIFGSAHFDPTRFKADHDLAVTIETVQNKGVLWSFQCLPLILHDRLMK